ncbi:MAG: hypothetical protein UW22_C0069G0005 [Candidatus Gottesmanbacteria bacterium GW2011_GWB1_44_11c]|uniref:Uncharacterized protein n=2 Tax=Candidatus Gottesmaniibacteriota TaxID=1752720 RepID=A0A0G1GI77_9BACT|nr:MAG: hypothetical protein UW22_C0069G0005 [Candidatus Gottesmanbacteria bacterium GW2011_GWB1_44_11c]HCM82038.1 hypothetical protein [Patescibacteria group bacterium]
MVNKTMTLHQYAEQLREQNKPHEALRIYEDVILAYQEQGDYAGLVEALMGRGLTYKHLYGLTHDVSFATIARHTVLSSLEIAQTHNLKDKIYRCYFHLGEMEILFQNYARAIECYTTALSQYPNDAAEKGDFQYHLGSAQYRSGNREEGKRNLIEGMKKIEEHESSTDSFLFHVWQSGGYMTMAELLWHDVPIEAKKYLHRAEQIINADNRLIIRKRQLQQLKEKLPTTD